MSNNLKMLDYYRICDSTNILYNNDYSYITSIEQDKNLQLIDVSLLLRTYSGENFKKFIFGMALTEDSTFKNSIMKYLSVSPINKLISKNDGDTYYLNNLKITENENTLNQYNAASAKIKNFVVSQNDSSSNSSITLKHVNNAYGFQSSISPAVEILEEDVSNLTKLYIKSEITDEPIYIDNFSMIFNSSADSCFIYEIDKKNIPPNISNLKPLIESKLAGKNTENTIDFLDLSNVDIDFNSEKYNMRFIPSENSNSENLIKKLFNININDKIITDDTPGRKITVIQDNNRNIYSLDFDEFNEYDLEGQQFFSFGIAGEKIILSEYGENKGILFNKTENGIIIGIDKINEVM